MHTSLASNVSACNSLLRTFFGCQSRSFHWRCWGTSIALGITRVGGWIPQLSYLSGEMTLSCVFYTVSQGFPTDIAHRLPTVVTDLITHLLFATFFSLSRFPTPYQCFLELTQQWTICIEFWSQGLLLEGTHTKKTAYLMNLEQWQTCIGVISLQ